MPAYSHVGQGLGWLVTSGDGVGSYKSILEKVEEASGQKEKNRQMRLRSTITGQAIEKGEAATN